MKEEWKNINWEDIKVGDIVKYDDCTSEIVADINAEYFLDTKGSAWNRYDYYGDELQYQILFKPNEKPKDDQFWWQDENQQGTLARALRNTKD